MADESIRAFPKYGELEYIDQPGMTLRDYFAGQALVGMVNAVSMLTGQDDTVSVSRSELAKQCYLFADAMVEVRDGGTS